MRVAVTGATGFVGSVLTRALHDRGDEVVAFSRSPDTARDRVEPGVDVVEWDPDDAEGLGDVLAGCDAVVHLAGEGIFERRWNDAVKAEIRASRVEGTRGLVEGLAKASPRPAVMVSASAVGYYGPSDATELDEDAPPGSDFLAGVCREWEDEARKAEDLGVRTVRLRVGVVLGRGGGALAKMVTPFKLFVGGPVGSGAQWLSWIHVDDLVGLILRALDDDALAGAVNATAPTPVTNREFSRTLGQVLGRPSWLPAPAVGLRVALGEVAEILVEGQRVVPRKADAAGYAFRFREPEAALRDLLGA